MANNFRFNIQDNWKLKLTIILTVSFKNISILWDYSNKELNWKYGCNQSLVSWALHTSPAWVDPIHLLHLYPLPHLHASLSRHPDLKYVCILCKGYFLCLGCPPQGLSSLLSPALPEWFTLLLSFTLYFCGVLCVLHCSCYSRECNCRLWLRLTLWDYVLLGGGEWFLLLLILGFDT